MNSAVIVSYCKRPPQAGKPGGLLQTNRNAKFDGMSQANQLWNSIQDKLQRVMQRYHALQKENAQLTREVQALKEKENAQARKIGELEIKLAALKTATGRLNEPEKKELDKRLNHYIREIDRCIALLSE
jgi:hypothetical protein